METRRHFPWQFVVLDRMPTAKYGHVTHSHTIDISYSLLFTVIQQHQLFNSFVVLSFCRSQLNKIKINAELWGVILEATF
jgi:hypothetical protein